MLTRYNESYRLNLTAMGFDMKDMVLVYRVECSRGLGFFSSDGSFIYNAEVGWENNCGMRCPMPDSDAESSALRDIFSNSELSFPYYFGFESLRQLENIFDSVKGRKACADKGIRIVVYVVDRQYVVYGKSQMVFKKEFAKVQRYLKFDDYMEFTPE